MAKLFHHEAPSAIEVPLTEVSAECEAFLAGTLAEEIAPSGTAPVWSWLNAIAHGDADLVQRLSAVEAASIGEVTVSTIAKAVIADGRTLDELQHEVLVPLELSIVGKLLTPRRLIELVGRSLFGS